MIKELTELPIDKPPDSILCHSELKGWLLDWLGRADESAIARMMMLVYNLWLARNDARDSTRIEDPRYIVQRTIAGLEEWNYVNCLKQKNSVKVVEHWLPPAQEWVKINVDGAFRSAERRGGGGVVIRDCHGNFMSGACHCFTHVADAEGAELMACKEGLLLAKEVPCQKIVLETDSVEVASKISKESQDRSAYGPLVSEIRALLLNFGEYSVRAVRRTANEAAHGLAKYGCDNNLFQVWNGVIPECIVTRVKLDRPSS
jgi:ribonuclease HI